MGNIGINNQYSRVSRPSVVRLKMNNGVDNGAGIQPSVSFGKTEGGSKSPVKLFTRYGLPKPDKPSMSPQSVLSESRLASLGGLKGANGEQLGNKTVFNLYQMLSLMITLSNTLNKTFREQMASRLVGEIAKLQEEARTLTNAAYTARTMGIWSAAGGAAMGTLALGGTVATGITSKGAQMTSGIDAANKALDKANVEMQPLQDFAKAQNDLDGSGTEALNRALEKTFTGQEGELQNTNIASQIEEKTKGILAFEDNEKTINELGDKLKADDLKQDAPVQPEVKEDKGKEVENNIVNIENKNENKSENNIVKVEDKVEDVKVEDKAKAKVDDAKGKGEESQKLTPEEREQIAKEIKSLQEKNGELEKKFQISKYKNKVDNDGNDLSVSEVYRNELQDRFDGKFNAEQVDVDDPDYVQRDLNDDAEIKQDGFNSVVDDNKSLKRHPFVRGAVKDAGAKFLARQFAILDRGADKTMRNYANAKMAFGSAQDIFKFKMENSRSVRFTQAISSMGQGLTPLLQMLTGGAGVNELANARTKDLQSGERDDSYQAGEMQSMKDATVRIVDAAVNTYSTATSSQLEAMKQIIAGFRA